VFSPAVVHWFASLSALQHELLLDGGGPRANGFAYLAGQTTWTELSALLEPSALTVPERINMIVAREHFTTPSYTRVVRPQLLLVETAFTKMLAAMPLSAADGPSTLLAELHDCLNITLARATQTRSLYDYVTSWLTTSGKKKRTTARVRESRGQLLDDAVAAMARAEQAIRRREAAYRVPLARIASWVPGPTVYVYRYLWTVHSLQFFWRDLYQASLTDALHDVSPCLLNIDAPGTVSFSAGSLVANFTALLDEYIARYPWISGLDDCLEPPKKEPVYTRQTK